MARLSKSHNNASGFLLGTAFAFAVLVAFAALAVAMFNPFGTDTVDRSGPSVIEQVLELEEFTAAEAEFVQDVDIESDTRFVPSVISGERVVAMASGTVAATVDFSGLDEDNVTVADDGTVISLTLPEPVLEDADIDEAETRIISRQRGVLDRVGDMVSSNPFDDSELYEAAAQKLNNAASEADLAATAKVNTQDWLETFLGAAGFERVIISWNQAPV